MTLNCLNLQNKLFVGGMRLLLEMEMDINNTENLANTEQFWKFTTLVFLMSHDGY